MFGENVARVWDAGAVALAGALTNPSCLEALGLSCTGVTDVAAAAFSRVLARGHVLGKADSLPGASTRGRCSLRRLDLSRNAVSDAGACSLAEALLEGNRSSARRDKADSWDREKDEKDLASLLPCDLVLGRFDEVPGEIPSRGDGFLALDLASNEIGSKGACALLGALREVPSMLFLELHGNTALGSHHPEVLLVEQECAERRRVLRSRRQGERNRSAVMSVGRQGVHRLRNDDERARSAPNGGAPHGEHKEMAAPMGKSFRRGPVDRDSTIATPSETSDERGAIGHLGQARESSALAEKRPRQGSLPMRGRYIGPLVDTCFDLLMLREPAADPNDQAVYVNRARTRLAESREERLRRAKEDGPTTESVVATSSNTPFPKGTIVSPLSVEADRRRVLNERRRLISIDKYYAARKRVKLTSLGRIKVPRSKVLTQKHANAAFTRELMRRNGDGDGNGLGVGSKCPTSLRSHFLGLQNFQYDWGGVA